MLALRALLLLALVATLTGCPPSAPRHAGIRCPRHVLVATAEP